ncbi:Aquaporin Z [Streptomyces californicus]
MTRRPHRALAAVCAAAVLALVSAAPAHADAIRDQQWALDALHNMDPGVENTNPGRGHERLLSPCWTPGWTTPTPTWRARYSPARTSSASARAAATPPGPARHRDGRDHRRPRQRPRAHRRHRFTLLALAYALGPISGCHVNPAVTLGMFVAGRIDIRSAVERWIAQFLGAIVGAALLFLLAHQIPGLETSGEFGTNGYEDRSAVGINIGGAFLAEVVLTSSCSSTWSSR